VSIQHIRIATHQSPLALVYTRKVASEIRNLHPHISIEIVKIPTTGDAFFYKRLPEFGGKSLFTSDVDQALLDGRADIAAHVIEDTARSGDKNWPRGWLSHIHPDDSYYFITDLKKLPELIASSRNRSK